MGHPAVPIQTEPINADRVAPLAWQIAKNSAREAKPCRVISRSAPQMKVDALGKERSSA